MKLLLTLWIFVYILINFLLIILIINVLAQPIKRIIAFNDNYKNLTHKEFYVIYNVYGTSHPYCVEYKQENKLIQRRTFINSKLAIECYNNIEL